MELGWKQIHANPNGPQFHGLPGCSSFACGLQNPSANIENGRAFGKSVDKGSRPENTSLGMPPPQQSFRTHHCAIASPQLGLEVKDELVIRESTSEFHAELASRLSLRAQ